MDDLEGLKTDLAKIPDRDLKVIYVKGWLTEHGNSDDPAAAFELIDQTGLKNESDYIIADSKGNQKLDLTRLASDILTENTFATFNDNDEILIYRDGYYQLNGARYIKAQCQAKIGITPLLTEHKIQEVIGHITRSTYTDRGLFNSNKYVLNLKNGLLDVRSRKLSPHTTKLLSTIRIPIRYDPTADCPAIKKFSKEVHKPSDIQIIQEIMGYLFIPDNTVQKAILYVGSGGEGKSTELNLFRVAVGKENCSNVSWHKLERNRFSLSALEGKLVNIFADLPSQSLNTTTSFKMLTGGDAIGTEKKFKDEYSFTNFARLIFSTNKPPKIYDDDSYAFWRRWVIIEFPKQIPEDKQDKDILNKLTTESELSGLLNWALDGLDRVLRQQGYSYKKTVEETTEYYLRAADPVYAFLTTDKCEVNSTGCVPKDDLYDAFVEYAKTNSIPILKPNAFARALTNQTTIRVRSTRLNQQGVRITAWEGVNLVKEVKVVNENSLIIPNRAPAQENILNKGKSVDYPDHPDTNSPDTSYGQDAAQALPPEYPTKYCRCGSGDYWLTSWGEWKCSKCHPEPKEGGANG